MAFRQYGGRNKSAISNYVNSEVGASNFLNVSNVVGQAGSTITLSSDINGNIGIFNRLTLSAETITENPQGVVPKYWIENLVRTGGIPPGKYYSDCLYWNTGTNTYDVDSTGTVHLGSNAGSFNQGPVGIAIGDSAGYQYQQNGAIAIGPGAGYSNQGTGAIALGDAAGFYSQSSDAIAIGYQAAQFDQLEKSIVIGYQAGNVGVGENCVLIGSNTIGNIGCTGSVAIGYNATISESNKIVLGTSSETVYVPGNLNVDGSIVGTNLYTSNLFGTTYTFTNDFSLSSNPAYLFYICNNPTDSVTITLPSTTITNYKDNIFYLMSKGALVTITSSTDNIYFSGNSSTSCSVVGSSISKSSVSVFCDGSSWYVW
jgi:hypothetical protein